MKYHESEEMYLETSLLLTEKGKEVRSIDIATELNYSRASVSRAVGLLVKKEYITIDNSIIKFTDLGLSKAKDIFEAAKKEGIFLRYFNRPRIDNYLRISIGTEEEMKALVEFLKKDLNK